MYFLYCWKIHLYFLYYTKMQVYNKQNQANESKTSNCFLPLFIYHVLKISCVRKFVLSRVSPLYSLRKKDVFLDGGISELNLTPNFKVPNFPMYKNWRKSLDNSNLICYNANNKI